MIRRLAEEYRHSLMSDRKWLLKYFDGEYEARHQMTMVKVIRRFFQEAA